MKVEELLLDDTKIEIVENSEGLMVKLSRWNDDNQVIDTFSFQVDGEEFNRLMTTFDFMGKLI
jgi:hypothetical protein